MGDKSIAVSIIMPVYNSEAYLQSCVDSILSQDFDSFELLLIDDGSTDGSPEICDEIARKDSRVRVFHKNNGGICEARNYGMERARGEYIAFSDHDDIVLPGFLKDNYKIASEHKADIIKFGRKALYIEGDVTKRTDVRRFPKEALSRPEIKERYLKLRLRNAMTCVWDGLYQRKFLMAHKLLFDIRYKKGGEDIDFCGRCFALAETLAFNNEVYYEHYIRKGYSTSTKLDEHRLAKFQMLIDNLHECCEILDISLNNPLFKLCIVKEQVYPTLSYLASVHADRGEMKRLLNQIHSDYFMQSDSLLKYLGEDKKWGIFTILFEMKQYWILYMITKGRSL
ncbi:glycosyltransferase family 2 protein [Oribacterium sp. P6A1]|uniref:glycosyltransferase family 2 protein n=1 Tax=Oribacterium sp. P6A1 TaxID=1410612 RepID=UPI000691CF79|nr:glycosyltransferase family 2 protein [Oribacterium sp. P6A1]